MNRLLKRVGLGVLVATIALAALPGCNSAPKAAEIERADIGPMPDPADTERMVRAWGEVNLKDPDSARYFFVPLKKGYYLPNPAPGNPLTAGKAQFAWEQGVGINAKNSYGGYTGPQPYIFFFRDGKMVYYYGGNPRRAGYGNYYSGHGCFDS